MPVAASSALTMSDGRTDLDKARGAGGRRHQLLDDTLPRRRWRAPPGAPPGGPAPRRGRAAGLRRDGSDGGAAGSRLVPLRPSRDDGSGWRPGGRHPARPPRRSRPTRAPGRGRRPWSSSRWPAAGSPMRRTRCARRSGSSSLKTSSSSRSGGRPSSSVSRSSSASLSARIAVRCWPREAKSGQVAAVRHRTRGRRDAVPRAWRRSRPPSRPSRARRRRSASSRRLPRPRPARSRRSAARARAPGARSRVCAAASGSASAASVSCRQSRMRPPASHEDAVPVAQLLAVADLLAQPSQQRVALGERPGVGGHRRPRRSPRAVTRARRGSRAAATASPRRGACPRARRAPCAGRRRALSARRLTPLTRTRLRPARHGRQRETTTSRSSSRPAAPTSAWLRAKSLPQRTSSTSAALRCERPLESTTSASRRFVLPAALRPDDDVWAVARGRSRAARSSGSRSARACGRASGRVAGPACAAGGLERAWLRRACAPA